MARLTFIDDDNETHDVGTFDAIEIAIRDGGWYTTVKFNSQAPIPDTIIGCQPQKVMGWDVVVTKDGQMYSGMIKDWDGMVMTISP